MTKLSPRSNRYWPGRSVSSPLFEDFDRFFDNFMTPTFADNINFKPVCDIDESEKHYLVSFDMPGVKKKDVKVEVKDNQLIVSGQRQHHRKSEHDERIHHEKSYGEFKRVFLLPQTVSTEKIEAHYEDGVLEITLPKAQADIGRTIEVQSGKSGFFDKLFSSEKTSETESKRRKSTEVDVKAS